MPPGATAWRAGPSSQKPRHSPPPGAGGVKTQGVTDAVRDSRGCGEASVRSLYKLYFQKDNSILSNCKICIFFLLVISYLEINLAVAKDSCTKIIVVMFLGIVKQNKKTNYKQQIHQNGNKLLTGNY